MKLIAGKLILQKNIKNKCSKGAADAFTHRPLAVEYLKGYRDRTGKVLTPSNYSKMAGQRKGGMTGWQISDVLGVMVQNFKIARNLGMTSIKLK